MRRIAVVASLALLSGCSTASGPQPVNQSPSQQVPAQSGGAAAPHAQPGSSEASSNAPNQPLDDKVAQLQAAYEKNPADASTKKQLADATFENAEYYMYKSPLPPNQKYPKALALYRQVVKLDPSNDAAHQSVETIEAIYRQMGRPIPEG